MLGPMDVGSSKLPSICTRPISVPIRPMAGEYSAALRSTLMLFEWRIAVACRS